MSAPKLLDLFCGAGGAGVGYHRAGFEVVGVDIEAHDDFPFRMFVGDALAFCADWLEVGNFDAVHASPPCPRYSSATPAANRDKHPDLIGPVRDLLTLWGGPYVIENVPGAPLDTPVTLCGSMFGLGVRRHRLFETNVPMMQPACHHEKQPQVWGVYGDHGDAQPVTRPDGTSRGNKARDAAHAREVMGIDWMTRWDDLADSIPPAYTEWLGTQLIDSLEVAA
jgi:DNA (cytosine-5)-methyltransferase 1